MKVLVTGLFEMAALHAIRRFGQMGYEVSDISMYQIENVVDSFEKLLKDVYNENKK